MNIVSRDEFISDASEHFSGILAQKYRRPGLEFFCLKKNSFQFFIDSMRGYFQSKNAKLEYLVSEEEGKFVRNLRWQKIREKLGIR